MGYLPYDGLIKLAIEMDYIRDIERSSHKMDGAYIGWQRVRKSGIPLSGTLAGKRFTFQTGFEGYFVGSVETVEDLRVELLKIGEQVWKGIYLLHKTNPLKIQELKKTILSNEYYTIGAVAEWTSILGAHIGRLRVRLHNNSLAQSFQMDTRQAVAGLPKIEYTLDDTGSYTQKYKVPVVRDVTLITCDDLTGTQRLYWETVLHLGKFGHPLVRAAASELYRYSESAQYAINSRFRKTQ